MTYAKGILENLSICWLFCIYVEKGPFKDGKESQKQRFMMQIYIFKTLQKIHVYYSIVQDRWFKIYDRVLLLLSYVPILIAKSTSFTELIYHRILCYFVNAFSKPPLQSELAKRRITSLQ